METNIRTFIGIVALGLIGFVNANATASNRSEVNVKVVSEKTEILTSESWMLGDIYRTILAQNETLESEKVKEVESELNEERVFFKSAESFTSAGANKEIEKYADKQIALEEIRNQNNLSVCNLK